MATKFERLIALVTQGTIVRDTIDENYGNGIDALDFLSVNETSIAVIVNAQPQSAGELAKDYIAYHYDDGAKPNWIAQAGL